MYLYTVCWYYYEFDSDDVYHFVRKIKLKSKFSKVGSKKLVSQLILHVAKKIKKSNLETGMFCFFL